MLIDRIKALKSEHPTWGRHRLAKALGVTPEKIRHALNSPQGTNSDAKARASTWQEQGDTASLSTPSPKEIRKVEDLMKHFNIDGEVWECTRLSCTKWDMGYVVDDEPGSHPLFRIRADFKRRVVYLQVKRDLQVLIDTFKGALRKMSPAPAPTKYPGGKDNMLEIAILDLHFGKLCWGKETRGVDWDSKLVQEAHNAAVDRFLHLTSSMDVGSFLLPVGNDLLHVDNARNMTAAGTPQDVDGRWQKSFKECRQMLVQTILRLRKLAPVKVVVVQGNHDTERTYYLGEALECYFHKTPGVEVDNSPALRKYVRHGENLIGFTHGDKEKLAQLPVIMANEVPQEWARTKFREWHLGHIHIQREWIYKISDELNTVRCRVIPALCPPDSWHASMGYSNRQAAEAYLWNIDGGCIGQFSYLP